MMNAIVTGCHGAIGRAICAELTTAGYQVLGLDKLGSSTGSTAPIAQFLDCDLTSATATADALKAIRGRGSVSLLVNNAGHYNPKSFFDLSLEEFDQTMAVNVRALFQLSQEVARWMVADGNGGAIVNIASIAGKLGSPIVAYGTSKAAVIGLTRSMARVLAAHGIRVNAIAPGVIDTPMSRAVEPRQMERQMFAVPMARQGQPEEVARVVRFLAGEGSSYMTGAVVDVAGGWMS